MITRFKIFEINDKGDNVIYTLKTKAKSISNTKTYEYNVNILNSKNGLTLSIETTPGAWYIKTLLEEPSALNYDKLSISGSEWMCDNWSDIAKELIGVLPKLELMVQADKYNL